jgi:hypothetical protein
MIRPLSHKCPSVLKKRTTHFRNWVNSMGRDGVTYEILVLERFFSADPLNDAEVKWINTLRSQGYRLINYTDGGGGTRGWKHSEETKQQFSKDRQGKKMPPFSKEHRDRLAASMKNSGKAKAALELAHSARRGVPPSEAAIKAITAFAKAPRSVKHRANIATALRGKKKTAEHIRNSVLAKQHNRLEKSSR